MQEEPSDAIFIIISLSVRLLKELYISHCLINTGMPKLYLNEHFKCECCLSENSRFIESLVVLPHERRETQSNQNCFVFILFGNVTVEINGIKQELRSGDLIFIAKRMHCVTSSYKACKVLIVRVKNQICLCRSSNIIKLAETIKKEKRSVENKGFIVLKICSQLWNYAISLVELLNDGLRCSRFLRNKTDELLILMCAYYNEEELCHIFYYILNPDAVFVEFVRHNWYKYRTIADFASAMNLSTQSFVKQFKEIYGRSPGEWIQEAKAKMIFMEIKAGTKTFQQISDDFDFTAQSNFSRFCKKRFGASPLMIRKNIL